MKTKIKLGNGFAEWTGEGWSDGEDRVLMTEREFKRFAIVTFLLGGASFFVFAFEMGRLSVIFHWL